MVGHSATRILLLTRAIVSCYSRNFVVIDDVSDCNDSEAAIINDLTSLCALIELFSSCRRLTWLQYPALIAPFIGSRF